jgi:hypothetical protein
MSISASVLLTLSLAGRLGGLDVGAGTAPLEGGTWYTAHEAGAGLELRFAAGALAGLAFLTFDLLLNTTTIGVFELLLQEGEGGTRFGLHFGALAQCAVRVRMPLEAVGQGRWRLLREGGWLKPLCRYDRVDLRKVDRLVLRVLRKGPAPRVFCLSPVLATTEQPELLERPLLPLGPLVDELGQSTLGDWPTRSRSAGEVVERLRGQLDASDELSQSGRSRWGGWAARQVGATGRFRTHHDGARWWLVDPDGHLFWSSGLDCVRSDNAVAYAGLEDALSWMPERGAPYAAVHLIGEDDVQEVSYLRANLIRAFGPDVWHARWQTIALAQLRGMGFNTIGNWSEWQLGRAAGVPYVRPMELALPNTPMLFRDFPDV